MVCLRHVFCFVFEDGDIGHTINARKVLNKQKNRFIEDRYLARVNAKKSDETDVD